MSLGAGLAGVHRVDFVAPGVVEGLLPSGVRPILYRSSLPRSLLGILRAYASRTLRAVAGIWRLEADFVLASPGLFDLVPAAVHRWRFGSRSAVFVFHLGDPRGGASRSLAQRWLSLAAQSLALGLWRRADVVVTSTEEVTEQLLDLGVPADRILRQLPCVDVGAVCNASPLPAPDVLFVGRLVRRKGIFDLLDAATGHDYSLGLVGAGEERENLVREVARRGLETRVEIFGAVSDERVWGLLKGCRCLALPSYEEGYSLVIAEAIVAGIPVVAYDLPHYPEVFGDAIFRVPKGDAEALGEEIRALLSGEREAELDRCREARSKVHIETAESAAESLASRMARQSTRRTVAQ